MSREQHAPATIEHTRTQLAIILSAHIQAALSTPAHGAHLTAHTANLPIPLVTPRPILNKYCRDIPAGALLREPISTRISRFQPIALPTDPYSCTLTHI
jgi:hypothetical protein